MAKRKATFRWLAARIAKASGSNWAECPAHWLEKAGKAASATSVEEMLSAIVNFPWMAKSAANDPKWVAMAESLLADVSIREFHDNLTA